MPLPDSPSQQTGGYRRKADMLVNGRNSRVKYTSYGPYDHRTWPENGARLLENSNRPLVSRTIQTVSIGGGFSLFYSLKNFEKIDTLSWELEFDWTVRNRTSNSVSYRAYLVLVGYSSSIFHQIGSAPFSVNAGSSTNQIGEIVTVPKGGPYGTVPASFRAVDDTTSDILYESPPFYLTFNIPPPITDMSFEITGVLAGLPANRSMYASSVSITGGDSTSNYIVRAELLEDGVSRGQQTMISHGTIAYILSNISSVNIHSLFSAHNTVLTKREIKLSIEDSESFGTRKFTTPASTAFTYSPQVEILSYEMDFDWGVVSIDPTPYLQMVCKNIDITGSNTEGELFNIIFYTNYDSSGSQSMLFSGGQVDLATVSTLTLQPSIQPTSLTFGTTMEENIVHIFPVNWPAGVTPLVSTGYPADAWGSYTPKAPDIAFFNVSGHTSSFNSGTSWTSYKVALVTLPYIGNLPPSFTYEYELFGRRDGGNFVQLSAPDISSTTSTPYINPTASLPQYPFGEFARTVWVAPLTVYMNTYLKWNGIPVDSHIASQTHVYVPPKVTSTYDLYDQTDYSYQVRLTSMSSILLVGNESKFIEINVIVKQDGTNNILKTVTYQYDTTNPPDLPYTLLWARNTDTWWDATLSTSAHKIDIELAYDYSHDSGPGRIVMETKLAELTTSTLNRSAYQEQISGWDPAPVVKTSIIDINDPFDTSTTTSSDWPIMTSIGNNITKIVLQWHRNAGAGAANCNVGYGESVYTHGTWYGFRVAQEAGTPYMLVYNPSGTSVSNFGSMPSGITNENVYRFEYTWYKGVVTLVQYEDGVQVGPQIEKTATYSVQYQSSTNDSLYLQSSISGDITIEQFGMFDAKAAPVKLDLSSFTVLSQVPYSQSGGFWDWQKVYNNNYGTTQIDQREWIAASTNETHLWVWLDLGASHTLEYIQWWQNKVTSHSNRIKGLQMHITNTYPGTSPAKYSGSNWMYDFLSDTNARWYWVDGNKKYITGTVSDKTNVGSGNTGIYKDPSSPYTSTQFTGYYEMHFDHVPPSDRKGRYLYMQFERRNNSGQPRLYEIDLYGNDGY
jgi:hypothetical protein